MALSCFTKLLLLLLSLTNIDAFSSFSNFQFAPNGVCTVPAIFQHDQHCRFTMKNVPGQGDCMFLAVALASLCSVGLGANDVLLNSISKETRNVVAHVLEGNGNLVIQGKRLVSTSSLLKSASKTEGVSPKEYIQMLRDGSLYGGGPELTVLSNVLRRPISIYELLETDDNNSTTQFIQCMGTFGKDTLQDPLRKIPDSAILQSNDPPGAYSWHLHILVVDVSPHEKHACALLPQPLL